MARHISDAQAQANHAKLADLKADIKQGECEKAGLARQANICQHAGKAEAVQQPKSQRNDLRILLCQVRALSFRPQQFGGDKHDG